MIPVVRDLAAPYPRGMLYLPISDEVAHEARTSLRDRFGHTLRIERNQAPCRSCLRISKESEDLILLSYQPLEDRNPYAEIGPIFIHAHACRPHDARQFPRDFADRELVVRAYDREGRIADAAIAAPGTLETIAAAFLTDQHIAELHVRHRSYTCFDFKVVRA
ncbi:MAG TPA: DUF1203 domain-containing protein [Candidatus Baltobacteraceae bacterium]|nr:DUF1203 domain-containing protein [Candidatus Baltobacteraceae bacterium]